MNRVYQGIFFLIFSAMSIVAVADNFTAENYILADLDSRRVTLAGMEARLALIQQGAGLEEQSELDAANRVAVEAVFTHYGMTATSHIIYGTQKKAEIDAFLEYRSDLQEQYNELEARFNDLSSQFDQ